MFLLLHVCQAQQAISGIPHSRHIMDILTVISPPRHGNLQFRLFLQRQFIHGTIPHDGYRHAQGSLDTQPFRSWRSQS